MNEKYNTKMQYKNECTNYFDCHEMTIQAIWLSYSIMMNMQFWQNQITLYITHENIIMLDNINCF